MGHAADIVVFSDLDGTLLDHQEYSWDPALPALNLLHDLGAGLVLATSKTAAEVCGLRDAIGFPDWPAIVENGGGLLAGGQTDTADAEVYLQIRAILADLPPGFRGFGDMTTPEISRLTGLPPAQAALARDRRFSEPGLWSGTEQDLQTFLHAASRAGLTAHHGGRFLTLSMGGTKADRMDEIITTCKPAHTIALGDAPNDLEMLQKADFGVIVNNPSAPAIPPLPGEARGRIRRTEKQGPEGWAQAVMALLTELGKIGERKAHG